MPVKSVKRFDQAKAAVSQTADRAALKAAHAYRKLIIERIMRGQKAGRVYGNHQASAPGESPANDTAALVRSIRVEHVPGSGRARVVIASAYGKMLELGTRHMAPRPFATPAIQDLKKAMPEVLRGLKIELKR